MGLYDDSLENEKIGVWGTVAKPQKWIKPAEAGMNSERKERGDYAEEAESTEEEETSSA